MDKPYSIRLLKGKDINRHLPEVASLRLRVFKEYPYLYEGNLKEEYEYLAQYVKPESFLAAAFSNNELIGAATGIPLAIAADVTQRPFIDNNLKVNQWFYIGEIILAPQWRNRGLGGLFLRALEDHAKELHYHFTTFCTIQRPPNHPLRPRGYKPLDEYWREHGYERLQDLSCELSWIDTGKGHPSPKKLIFWYKDLEQKK